MDVRLAIGGPPESLAAGLAPTELGKPALLVSFVYLDAFQSHRRRYAFRDWALDSGAYSAHNSGRKIELAEYLDVCRRLLASDRKLTEVFAFDVIGNWRASLRNCERMWEAGVQAIPCYHVGEPEHALKHIARQYPKIALGGAVGFRRKDEWAAQCFARVWPKAVHGFGFGSEKSVMSVPWHSVDATSWEIGPCKYGRWQSFGRMSVRGSRQNLRAEVEWYLRLERRARARWRKQMEQLDQNGPTIRLAEANANTTGRRAEAFAS